MHFESYQKYAILLKNHNNSVKMCTEEDNYNAKCVKQDSGKVSIKLTMRA